MQFSDNRITTVAVWGLMNEVQMKVIINNSL